MAMIGKVLRMHHRENKSVREIARATSCVAQHGAQVFAHAGGAATEVPAPRGVHEADAIC